MTDQPRQPDAERTDDIPVWKNTSKKGETYYKFVLAGNTYLMFPEKKPDSPMNVPVFRIRRGRDKADATDLTNKS